MTVRRGLPLICVLLAAEGCARYEPRPLDPSSHPGDYVGRRLDDPTLLAWVGRYAGIPEGSRWTDRQLALAALANRADIEAARREWLAARAGLRSAGARPVPGVEAEVERAVSGSQRESPWVVSLAALFTVELGGKRGARVQRARAGEVIAESELVLAASSARSRVRAAALAVVHAEQVRGGAEREVEGLAAVARLERGRYQEAALGSADVAHTGMELALAQVAAAAAAREVVLARAALAGELAVPAGLIRELRIEAAPADGCAWADALGADTVVTLAALRRGEVARALGAYALSEAELRLQVARQRPDLNLGPGFIWDQGVHRWTLVFALPALLGFRNRAAIEEAHSQRSAAAARVSEVQDAILAEADAAVESCRAAATDLADADSLAAAAERVAAIARAGYERGELGHLEQARAELTLLRAASAREAAKRRLESAGLQVEASVGDWRGTTPESWPDPREPGPAGDPSQ